MTFNKVFPFVIAFGLAAMVTACNNSGGISADTELNSRIDSVSYALGYLNGNNMKQQGMDDLDLKALLAGIKTSFDEGESSLSQQQMQQIVQQYQMQKQQQARQRQQANADENLQKGQDFLAENKTKEGIQVTDSGLQYKVLEEGSGDSPSAEDTVRVHYKGMHIDGTTFDSSYDSGNPAEFQLSGVIKGWTEGVQLMKEGAKYKFWLPAELAYGTNPRPGGPIEPNEVLIFEVELLEVK